MGSEMNFLTLSKLLKKLSILILLISNPAQAQEECDQKKVDEYLNDLLNGPNSNYKLQVAPEYPTALNNTFIIHDIIEVDKVKGSTTLSIFWLGSWIDSRLKLPCTPKSGRTLLVHDLHEKIWRPEMQSSGSTLGLKMSTPIPLRMVSIGSDGGILFLEAFQGRYPCQGNYKVFPFDTIKCNMYIAGNAPPPTIKLAWIDKPFAFAQWIKTGTFNLDELVYKDYSDFDDAIDELSEGLRSLTLPVFFFGAGGPRFMVTLSLTRNYGAYILTLYLPNFIIVFLAWLSLWFPFDSGRIGIPMTCLLSITVLYIGNSGALPKVSYIKGIDVFSLVCLMFIGCIFLEYTFLINLLNGKEKTDPAPEWFQNFKKRRSSFDLKSEATLGDFIEFFNRILKWAMFVVFVLFVIMYFLFSKKVILKDLAEETANFQT